MLAQELFIGYHKRGSFARCSMNVDIKKAYNIIEKDFLQNCATVFLITISHGVCYYDKVFNLF